MSATLLHLRHSQLEEDLEAVAVVGVFPVEAGAERVAAETCDARYLEPAHAAAGLVEGLEAGG